ncbi:MAG: MBL fold metallo-hydrolase [Verrucomicrobiae bacterium]|nr:MBL fold metallo-hydrolase [Verrucomicrobiae bacterium]
MACSLVFLGTADGYANAERNHAALLLRAGSTRVLLDAGQPCSQTLKRLGVGFGELDAIVVTHTHTDHVGGLPMLLQSMWLERRRRALVIWMPPRAIAPLRAWLAACYLFPERLSFDVRWQGLGKPIRIGGVRIEPFANTHLESTRAEFGRLYPRVGYESFSLLVQACGVRFGYSGDIGSVEDLEPVCRRPLDLLITELAHVSADAMHAFVRGRAIAHVWVTHVGRGQRGRLPGAHYAAEGEVVDLLALKG